MLCFSLQHQSVSDVQHALRIAKQQNKQPTIEKNYDMYFTCRGVYRGVGAPGDKLRLNTTPSVTVNLPWNGDSGRTFVEWVSSRWDKHEDELFAPLAVVSVSEKVFTLGRGIELRIITQGQEDNVVLSYADAECLDANLTRYL